MDKQQFYSHGKLLLTGEYFVLLGAKALAIPLNTGQHLTVEQTDEENILLWQAVDSINKTWFSAKFDFKNRFKILDADNESMALNMQYILRKARKMNKTPWKDAAGKKVLTTLTFDRQWGFGSSSTNISNIGRWLHIDAVQLLFKVSKGSGYDVAAAQINLPILYYLFSKRQPVVEALNFKPAYMDNILFVYSGRKQDTAAQIKKFNLQKRFVRSIIPQMDTLTESFVRSTDIDEIQEVIREHEKIVGKALGMDPVKQHYFSDFQGAVKSLGAWGGDFMMAVSLHGPEYMKDYFSKKGYPAVFSYRQLSLYQ